MRKDIALVIDVDKPKHLGKYVKFKKKGLM